MARDTYCVISVLQSHWQQKYHPKGSVIAVFKLAHNDQWICLGVKVG